MITLCENCFPDGKNREVLTIVPMTPCCQCERYDARHKGGLRAHVFSKDPRQSNPAQDTVKPTEGLPE